MSLRPFHLAFPVHDLDAAHDFYVNILGCGVGRRDTTWTDFNLYGHQIVAHHAKDAEAVAATNPVDGHDVPVPHFGVVLSMEQWQDAADRLKARDDSHNDIHWVIEPTVRFRGQVGEQATFFLLDPSGNALEFKAFADDSQLFAV